MLDNATLSPRLQPLPNPSSLASDAPSRSALLARIPKTEEAKTTEDERSPAIGGRDLSRLRNIESLPSSLYPARGVLRLRRSVRILLSADR